MTGSCDGETDGRRLCCSTWRAGEASLASDHGQESFTRLRLCCAPVHVRARRGRAGRGRGQAEAHDRERADAALRGGRDRPGHLRRRPRDPRRRQAPDQDAHGRPQGPARGRAGDRRGHRRARAAARRAAVPALPHAAAQRRVVVDPAAARRRPARHVRGLRARLAVRARPGPPAPPARQLRQAQRLRQGQQAQQRAQHRAARRADGDRGAARRRARVGVLLHVRRRQAAVGQRARAGHRPAGDRALRGQARPHAGAAAAHPGRG